MFQLTIQHRRHRTTRTICDAQTARLVSDVLRDARLPLNTRCGQRGLCDGCMVELVSGCLMQKATQQVIEAVDVPLRVRGCEYLIPSDGAAEIHVPVRSLLAHRPQVVTSFRLNVARAHDPLWQAVPVEQGDLNPQLPIDEALCRAIMDRDERTLPVIASPPLKDIPRDFGQRLELALEYRGLSWLLETRPSKKALTA